MDLMSIEIETERLLLKPISYNYVEDIFKEFNQEITKYMYPKPTETIEETKEILEVYQGERYNDLCINLLKPYYF